MTASFFQTGNTASWWLDAEDDADEDDPFKGQENEKDCTIFVLDCNEDMFTEMKSMDGNNLSIFATVCKAIENALKRKIIKSKDDLVCFILFNVLETNNSMKLSNIYLVSEPNCPSASLIKQIRDLPITFNNTFNSLKNKKQCDFRDLLWTLQNIFSEVDIKGTKYGSKRAFIFTNNDDPVHKDVNATIAKAKDMLESGMEISVFPLSENFRIKHFYGNICTFNLDEMTTESQFRAVCPSLPDLEHDLRVKEMKKRCLSSVPLTIGPNFKMAVKMYSLFRRATKESPSWLDARTNQPLTTQTRWICNDTGQILDDSQIKTYHEYGPTKEKIYFTKAEMKELKTFGNPSLTLMGFKPLDRLKPYYQFKPSNFIYPDEQRCVGSTVAFDALTKAMNELQQFAVCRYIARKQSAPCFVALVAQIEKIDRVNEKQIQSAGMHMIHLPFADDIRKIDIDGMNKMKRCNKKEDDALLDQCGQIIEILTCPDLSQPTNPVLQKHYDALEAIALDMDEDDEEDVFLDEIEPDDEGMLQAAEREIDALLESIAIRCGAEEEKVKPTRKRKANDGGTGAKKKKRKVEISNENLDWKKLAENDELKSLKVKDLKVYLSQNGLKMSGKKADLIERIKGHIGL
eukprot:53632_1